LSGFGSVGTLLAEHLEDDTAEVSSKGSDGLVVFLSFGAPQMLGSEFAVAGE